MCFLSSKFYDLYSSKFKRNRITNGIEKFPLSSPETLRILKKSTSKKPAKFRDANPRRTKGRKRKEKGKGSKKKKKDKPFDPTPPIFPQKKEKEKTPIHSPCTTMPRVQVLAPLRAENPRRLSRNRSPLPVAFLPPLPTISFSSTRAARIHLPPPPPHSPPTRFAHELFTTGRKWLSIDNPASTARFHRYKRRASERARWRYR